MLEQVKAGKHGAVGTDPAVAGVLDVVKGKHGLALLLKD